MWLKWLPWRFVVRRVARARGFIDPISLLSHLHRFAQPSEVAAPLELLRAGVVFHARGLMNTGAIQHNLDWVWPYWVERQFDPSDDAFIPRAFSITHVNLTHRNWTAVGWPDHDWLPIVDPRGLLTPFWDGWSIDGWVFDANGTSLLPSRIPEAQQRAEIGSRLAIETDSSQDGMELHVETTVQLENGRPLCVQRYTASAAQGGWLVLGVRPYNPEGVSFVHHVALDADGRGWKVDREHNVRFDQAVDRSAFSTYRSGDVFTRLPEPSDDRSVDCDVGMATAAAMFALEPGRERTVELWAPLKQHSEPGVVHVQHAFPDTWSAALQGHCKLQIPNARWQELYDLALRTLVLHSPGDVYPGPYTYKRFWFRDAAFILYSMLCAGLGRRVEPVLSLFAGRQTSAGYFLSQEGEWDSNGEALWILDKFCALTGAAVKPAWRRMIDRGGQWLLRKLTSEKLQAPHAGLLPAGFSAEHLGPNDFYYWDDYWAVAGLRSAASMIEQFGDMDSSARFRHRADRLMQTIDRSIEITQPNRGRTGIPASPYRRMDAGVIGSIVGGYPLQLYGPKDRRLLDTADFLIDNCFYAGGFFQDMIHSGINAYLTLHVAQVLLRAGDPRYLELMETVAELASPTGQWPEAIHPRTRGGCMGDGQHVWAAAEWVMMVRNCFVREEDDRLVLLSGVPAAWLAENLRFGPAPTEHGDVSISVSPLGEQVAVDLTTAWRGPAPSLEVRLPGMDAVRVPPGENRVVLDRVSTR